MHHCIVDTLPEIFDENFCCHNANVCDLCVMAKVTIKLLSHFFPNSIAELAYIRYAIAKPSKICQISMHTSSDSFFTDDSLKIKKGFELVSRLHFS